MKISILSRCKSDILNFFCYIEFVSSALSRFLKIFRILFSYRKALCKSFTITELAIGLAVSSVLLAGGIGAYRATNPKLRSDLAKLEKINQALQQFFTTNGRLPFPARPSPIASSKQFIELAVNIPEQEPQVLQA